jgi:uncharacterized protein (TIGR03067 family)
MHRWMTLAALLVGFTATAWAEDKEEEAKKFDPKAILGAWIYESGMKAGAEVPEENLKGTVTITEETITLEGVGGKFVMKYKLDGETSPVKFDMEMTESPFGEGAKAKGLMEVKDDKVVMAYVMVEGDADYPEKLESTEENKLHLFVLKKPEKPKDE